MKHVRKNRSGNYVASITIYPGKPENPKRAINVSGGTYPTQAQASCAAEEIYALLEGLTTYEEKRRVVEEYRSQTALNLRNKCCGIRIRPGWKQCPICGRSINHE